MKRLGLIIVFCALASAAIAGSPGFTLTGRGSGPGFRSYDYPGAGLEFDLGYAVRLGKIPSYVEEPGTLRSCFIIGTSFHVPLKNPAIQLGLALDYRISGKYSSFMEYDEYYDEEYLSSDFEKTSSTFFIGPEARFIKPTKNSGHYWFGDVAMGYVYYVRKLALDYWYDDDIKASIDTFGIKFSLGYSLPALDGVDFFFKVSLFTSPFKKTYNATNDYSAESIMYFFDSQSLSSVNFTLGFRFGL